MRNEVQKVLRGARCSIDDGNVVAQSMLVCVAEMYECEPYATHTADEAWRRLRSEAKERGWKTVTHNHETALTK